MKKVLLSGWLLLFLFTVTSNLVLADDGDTKEGQSTVTVLLLNSKGEPLQNGTLKYFDGSWHSASANGNSSFTVTTNASSVTYKMSYEDGSVTKTDIPVTAGTVTFQTVDVSVQLKNSLGELFDEGSVEYFSGNWFNFFLASLFGESHYLGTTHNGIASKELLPGRYIFKMTHEHSSKHKIVNIGTTSIVTFTTVRVTAQLNGIKGGPVSGGKASYYPVEWFDFSPDEWYDLGQTTNGEASKELLPKAYVFKMELDDYSQQKVQHVQFDPLVIFNSDLSGNEPLRLTVTQPVDSITTTKDSILVSGSVNNSKNATVTVNGVVVTIANDGSFNSLVALTEGGNSITIEAESQSGEVEEEMRYVIREIPIPELTVTSPADSITTLKDSILVSGSVDKPGSTIVAVNGSAVSVAADSSFSTVVNIAEGENTITVSAENEFGKIAEVQRFVMKDTTPPKITVISPADSSFTNQQQLAINGSVSEEVSYLVVHTDTISVDSDGNFSALVPISEGINDISIKAADFAGNNSQTNLAVTGDFQEPNVGLAVSLADPSKPGKEILEPTDGDTIRINQNNIYLSGNIDNESGDIALTINQQVVPVQQVATPDDTLKSFEMAFELNEETNVFAIKAKDQAGNVSIVNFWVKAPKIYKPSLSISYPPNNFVTDSSSVYVSGTVIDTTESVSVTVNDQLVTIASNGAFSHRVSLYPENNYISIKAVNADTNETTRSVKVYKDLIREIPPNPEDVAPELDSTVVTTMHEATEFLYEGEQPIQQGVEPGTIELKRAAVVRGAVLGQSGDPLSGVLITVLDHPEYGYTLTREDGEFDMAVNGGGNLTFSYEKDSYLSIQRQSYVSWQDYASIDSVMMTTLDPNVTIIDFSDTVQVAQGSRMSDADGSRQATMLFKQGTSATMVLPDGSEQPLDSLNFRATEYTVGENGPASMPAKLPPSTGYTYAVEFSADEAIAAGATEVHFDRPVVNYTENFLGFPIGSIVPTGYYNRKQGKWIPSKNGKIIEIKSITNGLADVDITGDGRADPTDSLQALGIDESEQKKLALLYNPGVSLWRVEISHFTPWDHNWPFGPPADAEPPQIKSQKKDLEVNDKSCYQEGSIISVQNQTLGETVDITGAPCGLYYSNSTAPGFKSRYRIPVALTDSTFSSSLQRIELVIDVAGTTFKKFFEPEPNLSYDFEWDGRDVFGRKVQGTATAYLKVGYEYKAEYKEPNSFSNSFSRSGGTPIYSRNREENTITLWQNWSAIIGQLTNSDFGGWHPGIHHRYDFTSGNIYKGNGAIRRAQNSDNNVRVALNKDELNNSFAADVAFARDGSMYVVTQEFGSQKIIRQKKDGTVETLIEVENCFLTSIAAAQIYPATECLMIADIDISPDGSVYFVDSSNTSIFKIDEYGELETIAGGGLSGGFGYDYTGDGGPAIDAGLLGPENLTIADDGTIYLSDRADYSQTVIRRIGTDGIITTFAGTGVEGFSGDGGPAREARFMDIEGMDVGPDGSLYVVDNGANRVRKITPDGIITTVAGSGNTTSPNVGNGGTAITARLIDPTHVTVGRDGRIYITESNAHHIRKVTPGGIIYNFAGLIGEPPYSNRNRENRGGFNFNNAPAANTRLSFPNAIVTGPDDNIYFTENGNPFLRMIETTSRYYDGSEINIASKDGSRLYKFNSRGKHLKTTDVLTGNTIFEFGYNRAGLLASITDIDGLTTTIERNSSRTATAFVSPFGQRTELTMGGDGYLASVTNPAGETTSFTYNEGGLLTDMTDPKENLSSYAYDSLGYLKGASYPNGGTKELMREETKEGFRVKMITAEGNVTQYEVDESVNGTQTFINTDANGLQTVNQYGSDGSVTVRTPDSSTTYTRQKPDPRFGMQVPLIDSMAVETPSGLVSTMAQSRTITQYTGDKVTGLTDSVITNGKVTISVYDGNQRRSTTTSPEGRQSFSYSDSLGRVIQTSIPGLEPVNNTYNNDGFLIKTGQGGRTTTYTYDSRGRVESITDPLGRTQTTEYDSVGRVTSQTLPNGEQITYNYDTNGNLTAIAPPGQPAHTFSYTTVDQKESYTPPTVPDSAGGTRYVYNKDQQLLRTIYADSTLMQMVYDTTGGGSTRPTTIIYDRGSTAFTYDSTSGNLRSITSSDSVTTTYRYDGSLKTRATTRGLVSGTIDYTYDNDFEVTAQRINGANTIGFSYDDDGLLVGAGALSMSYDAQNGLLESATLGNISSSYAHNGFGELTGKTATYNGSELYNRSFTRDSLGRITSITETIGGQTDTYAYNYNDIGYLTRVKKNGAVTDQYQYDANGNRTAHSTPEDTTTATYDAQDRMLTYGNASYRYGPRGDLQQQIVAGETKKYHYDNQGHLRSVTLPDGMVIEYLIDGQGRRVAKKVNGQITKRWLYGDGLMPVAELDAAGNVQKRYGPGYIVMNDTTYRVIKDHLGSVRMVVNCQTGEVVQRIDYDAWGNNTYLQNSEEFITIGFAGGLYDRHTGLVRFGARDYDPEVGRWTTKDPIGFGGGTSNLYEYVLNDPVNNRDFSGLQAMADSTSTYDNLSNSFYNFGLGAGASSAATDRYLKLLNQRYRSLYGSNLARSLPSGRRLASNIRYLRSGGRALGIAGIVCTLGSTIADAQNPNVSATRTSYRGAVGVISTGAGFVNPLLGVGLGIIGSGAETVYDNTMSKLSELNVRTENALRNGWVPRY